MKTFILLFSFSFVFLFTACTPRPNQAKKIDLQGHRGARGLMPENTIPAFIKALDLGVNTLEMDVVITKDKKVLLSHEAFMSSEICLDSLGQAIPDSLAKFLNIYEMNAEEVQSYDCGSKPYGRFPQQQKLKVSKPLLSAVIDTVEAYIAANKLAPVFYNIETKSVPDGDDRFHPKPDEFVRLLLEVIDQKGIADRTIIQSFDPRTLQATKALKKEMVVALLVYNEDGYEANIQRLGFLPEIYSCYFPLVTDSLMDYARQQKMKVIPWTVNDSLEMKRLVEMGVDGIITDYPDLGVKVLR
ncbi:MAG: glycerophosphodiester phosphodiesterase family protein [Chitinophagales bacterium]